MMLLINFYELCMWAKLSPDAFFFIVVTTSFFVKPICHISNEANFACDSLHVIKRINCREIKIKIKLKERSLSHIQETEIGTPTAGTKFMNKFIARVHFEKS